jgi:hypothetical protein
MHRFNNRTTPDRRRRNIKLMATVATTLMAAGLAMPHANAASMAPTPGASDCTSNPSGGATDRTNGTDTEGIESCDSDSGNVADHATGYANGNGNGYYNDGESDRSGPFGRR